MKIYWKQMSGLRLRALYVQVSGVENCQRGLSDSDLTPVHQWCINAGTGHRESFDTFKFKSESDLMIFLLRW